MKALRKIEIKGFKSIESAELEFGDLNVMIGANGSGKSNLVSAFRLLDRILTGRLQDYIASDPDRFLFHGRKVTPVLSMDFDFGSNGYNFDLKVAQDTLIFENECVRFSGRHQTSESIGGGHKESLLKEVARARKYEIPWYTFSKASDFVLYHFHDTSDASPAKQTADVEDNAYFRPDAANLPAYLYWLQEKHPVEFQHIEEHIRLVAPFFEKFLLAPSKLNERKIKLEWRQKGSDAYFDAYSLSDGTLRFICLATLLLQPNPPALILLDEPELGLHPFAIRVLSEMLESVSRRVQVLLATQSVTLLNHFSLEDVIVAEHDGAKTTFKRLKEEDFKNWLERYSLGDLWEKNVFGGRP